MEKTWKVAVWGVRGSCPVPSAGFMEYGGNTVCVSVDRGKDEGLIFFDAGSGIAQMGNDFWQGRKKRLDILFSHLHIDHVMGLFGLRLFYDPSAQIHLYGEARDGRGFKEQLETLVGPPYWPMGFKDFPACVTIHEIRQGDSFVLEGAEEGKDVVIRTLRGNHPNQSLLYRMEAEGKRLVYALDCEMDEEMFEGLVQFSKDSCLILCDATFTKEELTLKKGWGHSSWEQGIALQRSARAEKVLFLHYSTEYSDEFLRVQEQRAREAGCLGCFAREGMELAV